jgi:hypothetical protein
MDSKKFILIFSIVAIVGVSVYFLTTKKDEEKSGSDEKNNDTFDSAQNNKVISSEKLQFFSIENDLSKSIYAKWRNSNNIYPVTKSLAIQYGVDHEQGNVIFVTRAEYEKYNLCEAVKEGEIHK